MRNESCYQEIGYLYQIPLGFQFSFLKLNNLRHGEIEDDVHKLTCRSSYHFSRVFIHAHFFQFFYFFNRKMILINWQDLLMLEKCGFSRMKVAMITILPTLKTTWMHCGRKWVIFITNCMPTSATNSEILVLMRLNLERNRPFPHIFSVSFFFFFFFFEGLYF